MDTEKDKVEDFSTRFMQTVIKKFWDCTYKKAETLPPHFKVVSICTYAYFRELAPIYDFFLTTLLFVICAESKHQLL